MVARERPGEQRMLDRDKQLDKAAGFDGVHQILPRPQFADRAGVCTRVVG